MNHTQKNEKIDTLETTVKTTFQAILDLRRYLNSPKFHCGDSLDNYVNTSDVHNRLDIITEKLLNNDVEIND